MIPKAVTSIGNYVFNGCSALKAIVMENREDDTPLTLGSNGSSPLFYSCPLNEVYIGRRSSYDKSSSKGYSPFYRNTSLSYVGISEKETEISVNEFYGCTNLKEVKIGDGVTTIGNWAFSGCSSLDYFGFGSSVKTIGIEAFSDCTAMIRLMSRATTPPSCGSQALDDINKWNCKLTIPTGSLGAYQAADQWKEFFFVEEGDMTPIDRVEADKLKVADIIAIYDLNGQKKTSLQRGLNIVKMSDGRTKKIAIVLKHSYRIPILSLTLTHCVSTVYSSRLYRFVYNISCYPCACLSIGEGVVVVLNLQICFQTAMIQSVKGSI